jgi:hypothetical protein
MNFSKLKHERKERIITDELLLSHLNKEISNKEDNLTYWMLVIQGHKTRCYRQQILLNNIKITQALSIISKFDDDSNEPMTYTRRQSNLRRGEILDGIIARLLKDNENYHDIIKRISLELAEETKDKI